MAAPWVGLNQAFQHSIAGGATPAYVAFDKVLGGNLGPTGGELQSDVGMGGQASTWRGPYGVAGSVNGQVQTLGLFGNIIPATVDVLPAVIALIQGGPHTDASAGREHATCYLTNSKLSVSKGGVLQYAHSWIALTEAACTIDPEDKQTVAVYPWHKVVVELDSAAYKLQSLELELAYDATTETSCDEKTAGSERAPEWAEPGILTAKLKASIRVPLALTNGFLSDVVDRFALSLVASNTATSPATFTVGGAGNGWALDADPMPIVAGKDQVLFEIQASGDPNDLALVTFAYDDGVA
jgi:hypothetical protein